MGWFGSNTSYKTIAEYAKHELAIDNGTLLDRVMSDNVVYSLVRKDDGEKKILVDMVNRAGDSWEHKP